MINEVIIMLIDYENYLFDNNDSNELRSFQLYLKLYLVQSITGVVETIDESKIEIMRQMRITSTEMVRFASVSTVNWKQNHWFTIILKNPT